MLSVFSIACALVLQQTNLQQTNLQTFSTDELCRYVEDVKTRRNICGPISVWYSLHMIGFSPDARAVIKAAKLDAEGSTLADLVELCQSYGASASCVEFKGKDLAVLPIPAILVINSNHCIVYKGLKDRETVNVFDPNIGHVTEVPVENVTSSWNGIAVIFGQPYEEWPALLGAGFCAAIIGFGGAWAVDKGGLTRILYKIYQR